MLRLATRGGCSHSEPSILFYIAGTLAAKGFNVSFVPEQGKQGTKTPDLLAKKGGRKIWIEANAKQPKRTIDTPKKIWQMIRDIIDEKSQKFSDPKYSPGMIVADISTAYHLVNENGTVPFLKLRLNLCRPFGRSLSEGFIYPLYEDAEWKQHKENQGNLFAIWLTILADRSYQAVDHVSNITRQSCTTTYGCFSRKVTSSSYIGMPETAALTELSKIVYVID